MNPEFLALLLAVLFVIVLGAGLACTGHLTVSLRQPRPRKPPEAK